LATKVGWSLIAGEGNREVGGNLLNLLERRAVGRGRAAKLAKKCFEAVRWVKHGGRSKGEEFSGGEEGAPTSRGGWGRPGQLRWVHRGPAPSVGMGCGLMVAKNGRGCGNRTAVVLEATEGGRITIRACVGHLRNLTGGKRDGKHTSATPKTQERNKLPSLGRRGIIRGKP